MSILIRNVRLDDEVTDVFIRGNRFERIGPDLDIEAEKVLDGRGKAILPSFVNGHTHAAMSLLRGYADDMELHTWLTRYIWPLEARLTEEDVYAGTRLACLEMIKSGTTFFNDMYWHWTGTARAVEEMGLRAGLSSVFIDFGDPGTAERHWQECRELFAASREYSKRISFLLGPHSVYAVSADSLRRIRDFALEQDLLIHIHLSETEKEVRELEKQLGKRPVEYLDDLGLLGPNLVACHCLWLNEQEIELLAEKRVKVIHNPVSNMKLCSGGFPYARLRRKGVAIGLGTDGCSSNNNLDMLEEMKFASLAAKDRSGDPTLMPAAEIFAAATLSGAEIFGLEAGRIREGYLADCILVDLGHHRLTPNHNLISNLVYAANGDCVQTTICDGKILMSDQVVDKEEEILAQAGERARKLNGLKN
ncbi:MAG: amidohydrolase [Desulfohalobiaceae bacterium]|nr:amidohydrolase [Desulfohalobiaceae bacterium]